MEKVLFETDAQDAIWDMVEIWRMRPGFSEEKEFFGLSEPEFYAWVIIIYNGDVGNGGHSQYFMNFGEQSAALSRALDAVGLDEAADIFRRALSVFPDGKVPADNIERFAVFEAWSEDVGETLAELDREFYEINLELAEPLVDYLRKNEAFVFQPERNPPAVLG